MLQSVSVAVVNSAKSADKVSSYFAENYERQSHCKFH